MFRAWCWNIVQVLFAPARGLEGCRAWDMTGATIAWGIPGKTISYLVAKAARSGVHHHYYLPLVQSVCLCHFQVKYLFDPLDLEEMVSRSQCAQFRKPSRLCHLAYF